jgi:hypothetical protein
LDPMQKPALVQAGAGFAMSAPRPLRRRDAWRNRA